MSESEPKGQEPSPAKPGQAPGVVLTEEQRRRRRVRSIVIGLSLAGLVVLFYVVTIVRLGPQVLDRPL